MSTRIFHRARSLVEVDGVVTMYVVERLCAFEFHPNEAHRCVPIRFRWTRGYANIRHHRSEILFSTDHTHTLLVHFWVPW